MELTLYSTDHCTMCEQALDLLVSMPEAAGAALAVVDVATDNVLLERFGERVPVLIAGDREFSWPFEPAALAAALVALRDT